MSDLGPDARSILDAARDGDEPTTHDRVRLRAALVGRLGLGAGIVTASVATATTGKAAAISVASSFTKMVIFLGVVSVAATGVILGTRHEGHGASPAPSLPSAAATTGVASVAPSFASSGIPAVPAASTLAVVEAPSATVSSPRPASPIAVPAASISAKPDTLADELAIIAAAMSALGAGDGERALTLLDEHASKYPEGTMAEERNGARCIAACMAGRSDARAQATSFLEKHPNAPLRVRIEKACGSLP